MPFSRALAGAAIVAAAAVSLVPTATAQTQSPTGWNGANPFNCVLQQAGFGTVVPDPDADPYCVEFDKRRQNLTQLGLVDFLAQEPARVAAATPKCFYFQSDHWRGSVVQDDPSTSTYEFDGHYFFDKARGEGGVWVTNFKVNGQTSDPNQVPGIPPEYAQHFGPGTGGFITRNQVQADPDCIKRARDNPNLYVTKPRPGGAPSPRPCAKAAGGVTSRRIAAVSLGSTEEAVRRGMGDPAVVRRGFLRYCLSDGTSLLVGHRGDRSGELGPSGSRAAVMLIATSPALRFRRAGVGTKLSAVRRAYRGVTSIGTIRGVTFYRLGRRSNLLVGVRRGLVGHVVVYDRRIIVQLSGLRNYLSRGLAP